MRSLSSVRRQAVNPILRPMSHANYVRKLSAPTRFKFIADSISDAKPDALTLAKAPHHLIGIIPLSEEMNAEKFRRAASHAMGEINSRGKIAIAVGGNGLYIKALTHGLAPLPPESDPELREN